MAKNTICLWYDKNAEEAAKFYAATFPDSRVGAVHLAPADYPDGKRAMFSRSNSPWRVSRALASTAARQFGGPCRSECR